MEFGEITEITVKKNADGDKLVRLAQVLVEGEDTVTVELPFAEGDEFVPAVGDRVYYEEVNPEFLRATCIQTDMDPDESLSAGERELFSRSGSSRAATVRLKADGEIVLNNGDDYATRFNALEAAVNALVDSINAFFKITASHTHSVAGSVASKSLAFELAKDASIDMSDAKAPKVRT